jgi:hypothetical protein
MQIIRARKKEYLVIIINLLTKIDLVFETKKPEK